MQKPLTSFLKGVGTGAAIGVMTAAAVSTMKSGKSAKRKISNAVKTASDFMDNISCMLK
ncbi:MAG: hypothetical protein U0L17_06045 [Acutalibacteraceae bacterium]|nr:hypothetical protein [Acutalibacteraceae bacterium]